MRALAKLSLLLVLALSAACGGTGLKAAVVRSKDAPARPATPADVEIYFYEKEPPYEVKPVGSIDLTGTFPEGMLVEDQEWELRERLEAETRAMGGDTVIVMGSKATPRVEVRAVAYAFTGKGKRPPYEGALKKKPRRTPAKGSKKKAGPATSAVDSEVPSGLAE